MVTAAEGRHRAPQPGSPGDAADPSARFSAPVELLIEALLAVSADLELDGVLRRTLEAACVLTGAPHGMAAISGERAILYGESASAEPLSAGRAGLITTVLVGRVPYARLHLAARADGSDFDSCDELMLGRLVAAAGQAIGNALEYQHAGAAEAAVSAERDRIARDLHDTVIQQLFATGLQLQALRRTLGEEAGAGVTAAIRDLDTTMKDLRVTIYGLRRPRRATMLGQVEALVEEYAAGLGFRPQLQHSGPVEALLEGDLGDHVLATLREALSNIVKHAGASAADVELHVSPAWTMLRVRDNGVGIPPGESGVLGSGLANLRTRAERLGGLLRICGTRLDWIVPTGQ
ncbi:histidine kinase [Nocardioides sp. BP30]|uniref:sensor histidine kinase n=1 Tax=Nocardioides sp. BP30 TaxID=3036374 RepID=UPI002468B274|nr:histidine kinase [Nocardioides sp. BP30]WGL51975.1 histidine kinase [Nocardioides sp. BP30]